MTTALSVARVFWKPVENIVIGAVLSLVLIYGGITEALSADLSFQCSSLILRPSSRAFGPVQGSIDHLSLIVPFQPVETLRAEIDSHLRAPQPLKHRGEAHVTLITPPELTGIHSVVSLKELKEIATQSGVLTDEIKLECLGRGQIQSTPAAGQTYFLVVSSPALTKFRTQVEKIVQQRSPGNPTLGSSPFLPHITVGFTKKDLHFPDVVKSCEKSHWADIEMTN